VVGLSPFTQNIEVMWEDRDSTRRDLVIGSELRFEDHHLHVLEGAGGPWPLRGVA